MNDFFRSFASSPRLPSIAVLPKLNASARKSMTAPSASSSFTTKQNYNSIVGSMKSLVLSKNQGETNNPEVNTSSQTVLPKIGENSADLITYNGKPYIRKSKSENAVNSATMSSKPSLKIPLPGRQRRKSSLSVPLEDIREHDLFGGTLPPRALLKKLPKPIKQKDTRIEQLRKDIAVTGDSLKSPGGNSIQQTELSIMTTKDGKRRISRRRKDKSRPGSKETTENDDILDSQSGNVVMKKSKRKPPSRRGSIAKNENKKLTQHLKEGNAPPSSMAGGRRKSSVSNIGGLGMAMWIHKFLYKSRRSASMKIKDEEPIIKQVTPTIISSTVVANGSNPAITLTQDTVEKVFKPITTIDKPKPKLSTVLADNQIHSWDFLRNQLVSAKVRDAFSVVKFDLKSHRVQVLRQLGEGGYSKVFDVFDEKHVLYALKVVQILCEGEEEMDRETKKTKKIVEEEDIMKEIKILEMFQNTERVINMIDYEIRSDVSLPLCKVSLPAKI